MKKIVTTICLATTLLTLSKAPNAQGIYSENLKQASFSLSEGVYFGYSPESEELFTGVDIKKLAAGTLLTWKISDWNNVSRFEIQKSTNNKLFTTIGSVAASKERAYSFTDREPVTLPLCFRIKSLDKDGTVTYSNAISPGNGQPSSLLIAYPMPARNEITVQHTVIAGKGLISVHTLDGNLVMSLPPCTGTMQTTIDLSYLKPGAYILRFEEGTGKVETLRIVKQ
jgi:hypothetical protein